MAISWDDFFIRLDRTSKKDAYIYLSYFLFVFLMAIIINDVVHLTYTEETWKTTSKFTMALLLLHTLGFYFGLLGFIYCSQAEGGKSKKTIVAFSGIVGNTLGFIFRVSLEISCIYYRAEYYNLASESGK